MANHDYDIGIIGGGAAGLTAAAGAARFGAKTILIEKAPKLGGDCLHYGCVPSKALIRAAAAWAEAKRTPELGLPRLELPPVDLALVMRRIQSVIDKIQEHDSPERFCKLGAEIKFGDALFKDEHSVEVDGDKISATSWVVATGSSPALPPIEGLADVPYWTNESLFSQKTLPKRLIVLGGGPIGLEMAQSFQRLGSSVTIVEFMHQILGAEDPDIADIVRHRLKAEGMKILTDTKALKATKTGSTIKLTVAPASGEAEAETLEAEALLIATGRKPNIENLGLEAAGVKFISKGIPTDDRTRTNQKHIYACGDVNGKFPFTHVAGYEGSIALTNAVLRLPRKADYEKIPWCTYVDPEVASVGLNEKRAKKQAIEYRVIEEKFADNDRAVAEGAAEGKIKILLTPKGKLLGCQIIGPHAGELIHEWIIAADSGLKLSSMAGAIHVYPTLSEISKRVAGNYFSDKLFSERTKSVLKFLFQLKGRACVPPEDVDENI